MKTTDNFKKAIYNHLVSLAEKDPLFKESFENPTKNIDDCITYVLNTVYKSGINGFEDDEVYNMAIHYYDEENIEVGEKINSHVVVNHMVQLTEEEIQEAKQNALDKVVFEEKQRLLKKPINKVSNQQESNQASLF